MKSRRNLLQAAAILTLTALIVVGLFAGAKALSHADDSSPAKNAPPSSLQGVTPASQTKAPEAPKGVSEKPEKTAEEPKKISIDLGHAVAVTLPEKVTDLKPAAFKTSDGKEGWVLRIPGGRPIATPAYADGMIFVGGGYGSHEFYAFNAETGAVVWKISAGDDGPTAAVVEDGYVVFNTESCTLVVVEEKTGKVVWQEWLGDPLMSQPAIHRGRVYMAYPGGQRGHKDQTLAPDAAKQTGSHRLLSADLRTGKHIWEQVITGDVISAPVISGDKVYFTCFDGTSYALNIADGSIAWKKANAGTSAPVVGDGQVVMTRKLLRGNRAFEGVARMDAQGKDKDEKLLAEGQAGYLEQGKGGGVGIAADNLKTLDSSVGFSTAPASAKMSEANKNVGVTSVVGAWAYQGSRAALKGGQMLNAQGRYINSVGAKDGKTAWRAEVRGKEIGADAQVFSPPALGNEYMYLTSPAGYVAAVRQKDGEVGFLYSLKASMVMQPALARGNLYVGTADGLLICLKTGNSDADGWYAWGGNAQHNK